MEAGFRTAISTGAINPPLSRIITFVPPELYKEIERRAKSSGTAIGYFVMKELSRDKARWDLEYAFADFWNSLNSPPYVSTPQI